MLKKIGKTFDQFDVYKVTDTIGVSELGEILKIDGKNIIDFEGSYITNKIPPTCSEDDILNSIIDLENIVIEGHHIDIINTTFDDEEFEFEDNEKLNYEVVIFRNVVVKMYEDGQNIVQAVEQCNKEDVKLVNMIVRAMDHMSDVFVKAEDLI